MTDRAAAIHWANAALAKSDRLRADFDDAGIVGLAAQLETRAGAVLAAVQTQACDGEVSALLQSLTVAEHAVDARVAELAEGQ